MTAHWVVIAAAVLTTLVAAAVGAALARRAVRPVSYTHLTLPTTPYV